MIEHVVITKATYLASAVRRDQYPEERRPAVAFVGRSNVGKSSLINSLTRIRQLARVSSKPGKTQTINFYELLLRIDGGEERHPVHLVDLPGIPVLVIATKADKLGKNARRTQIAAMQKALGVPELTILPYASPKNEGRSDLLDVMKEYLVE